MQFVGKPPYRPHVTFSDVTVPADSVFVLGDNRNVSFDSRYWGFVPINSVVGHVGKIVPPD